MELSSSTIYEFKMKPYFEKYYNEDSNWGIYTFVTSDELPKTKEFLDPFKEEDEQIPLQQSQICGKMQKLYLGSEYIVKAKLEYNSKYKCYQYVPDNISAIVPTTIEKQMSFLKAIVTERQAEILLEAYPNIVQDTINGLVDNIDLEKTKGIKDITWGKIKEKIIDNYIISDILTLLQPLGVTYSMIKTLVDHYGNTTILKEDLDRNPYILTRLPKLSFKRVDQLALKLKPHLQRSSQRTYSFVKYYLKDIGDSLGHTWISLNTLDNAIIDNIPECEDYYYELLSTERKSNTLLYIDDLRQRVSLKYFRDTELSIYGILKELDSYETNWILDIEGGIEEAEKQLGFNFTDEQKDIIREATKHNVTLISGKAGTGKTTISTALLIIYRNAQKMVGCCALSAKASQRITEATGFKASTIHRLLKATGFNEFEFDETNPLPHDVVLLDESSMNNARITFNFLSAIKPQAKVIFCGDNRQLPPIGFGNVFSDLLQLSDQFNVNKLTQVHRQAEKSGILTDANLIREGINPIKQPEPKIIHGELQDMYYIFRDNRKALNEIAIKTFLISIEKDSLDEVVIITPRKMNCINSTKEINIKIQDALIGDNVPFIKIGNMKYKLGAKVIQRKNNYDKNVFNGEIGYIKGIYNDTFIVDYPNKRIEYNRSEILQLNLAYAITVHLSQGSGYKTVIVIIDNTHYTLLDACLLYTAFTRAKSRCLLSAEPKAFQQCIIKNKSIERQTWLKEFNQETLNNFQKEYNYNYEYDEEDDEED